MPDDLKFETRFSKSRGLFPYVAGALGVAVVVLLFMYITGIGRDRLPLSELFVLHPPVAEDGSEALSLQSLQQQGDEKTLVIDGTLANRTEKPIKGLVAVIVVNDKFTLPVQTVNIPVEPAELAPKGAGTFHAMITLGENGLGGYNVQFRLPNDGPFVPHKDERPDAPPPEPSEPKEQK